jgi:hypothetical protein
MRDPTLNEAGLVICLVWFILMSFLGLRARKIMNIFGGGRAIISRATLRAFQILGWVGAGCALTMIIRHFVWSLAK